MYYLNNAAKIVRRVGKAAATDTAAAAATAPGRQPRLLTLSKKGKAFIHF